MNKSLLTIIVLALFLGTLGFVVAAPPSQLFEENEAGYQIFEPRSESIPRGSEFKLHVHVSNISDGLMALNTDVECRLHLYNSSGSHTYKSGVMEKDGTWDHELTISGLNFTDAGEHHYIIWCNDTYFGGEVSGSFLVTHTGFTGTLGFYIVLLVIALILILIGYSVEDEWLVVLGGFGLTLLGLFTWINGINEMRDSVYTYSFSIILIFTGLYFAIRAAVNKLE